VPPALREAAMEWMGRAQLGFYDQVLSTKVSGRAFIPFNRHVIVAANHASHLGHGAREVRARQLRRGLGLARRARLLLRGPRWRRLYFENFTNLVPMARSGSLRQALRKAGELVDQGKTC
jgi:long-chain acyl-CoA synthetase